MIRFSDDYSEGAHPRILAALKDHNYRQFPTYGEDEVCAAAANIIREKIHCQTADVHFIEGGTHANLTVIAAALRPHQAVVAVDSGHINVHETGAIEATGHKVIAVPGYEGRLTVASVAEVWRRHNFDQMVKPALLYLSQATEWGTVYTKEELRELYDFAKSHGACVFIDGARLAVALAGSGDALTFADLPEVCDVFTIGGTKNGALFGEAIVIVNDGLKEDFRFHMRQRGALFAKGWLLGIQFWALLRDNLYLKLAEAAIEECSRLRRALDDLGCGFVARTATNLVFPILPRALVEQLAENFTFHIWEDTGGDQVAVRLVTSWATPPEQVDSLIAALRAWYGKAHT